MAPTARDTATIGMFARTDHDHPSIFRPENLLREARRQRNLPPGTVPDVCLLDPDGDIVRFLRQEGRARRSASWACYHTDLWLTELEEMKIGVVGNAVGASFAVLIAEQLFASGCALLVSISSAGKIDPDVILPDMILIDRALRGEGASHAYLPTAPEVEADSRLMHAASRGLERTGLQPFRGTTWTTDAPYRETSEALAIAVRAGAVIVEMEAAALYAFGEACGRAVICLAHVTNTMAVSPGDFEKGPRDGAEQALAVTIAAAKGWIGEKNAMRQ
jgi:uridine phosphorylase